MCEMAIVRHYEKVESSEFQVWRKLEVITFCVCNLAHCSTRDMRVILGDFSSKATRVAKLLILSMPNL